MNPISISIQSARRGTTLVEVLLGLTLLATLLVAVIIARGRFLRQWADADRKLRLVAAADQLMSSWTNASPEQFSDAGGALPDVSGAAWRTRLIQDPAAAQLTALRVHLDVFDPKPPAVAVTLEFLVHNPRATTVPAGAS